MIVKEKFYLQLKEKLCFAIESKLFFLLQSGFYSLVRSLYFYLPSYCWFFYLFFQLVKFIDPSVKFNWQAFIDFRRFHCYWDNLNFDWLLVTLKRQIKEIPIKKKKLFLFLLFKIFKAIFPIQNEFSSQLNSKWMVITCNDGFYQSW